MVKLQLHRLFGSGLSLLEISGRNNVKHQVRASLNAGKAAMSLSAQFELKHVTAVKTETCQRYSQGSLSVLDECVFLFSLYCHSVTEIENMAAENVNMFLCLILQAETAATE